LITFFGSPLSLSLAFFALVVFVVFLFSFLIFIKGTQPLVCFDWAQIYGLLEWSITLKIFRCAVQTTRCHLNEIPAVGLTADHFSYNALIQGCERHRRCEDALQAYDAASAMPRQIKWLM
jgi:pentatricopeptide repeat protein